MFGLLSNSSTLLVRDSPGQPGVALRQLRATGRGATAPAVDRRRGRGKASELPDMGRALTEWVNNFDARFAIFPSQEYSNRENKKGEEDSILAPKSLSKHCVFLLPDSVTSAILRRCLQLSSLG